VKEELTHMYGLMEDIIIGLKRVGLALILGIVMVLVLMGLHGCATATLPQGSTPEQVNAAFCKDAQMGLAVWTVAMAKPSQTAEEKAYWDVYIKGVRDGVTNYCMKP
jgi:hypothetical protein